jgi:hypothetical protein
MFNEELESEAFEYGARVAPYGCEDANALGDWFVGFAMACREALDARP